MTKDEFASSLLRHFCNMSAEDKYYFLQCLMIAGGDIDADSEPDSTVFADWAKTLAEVMFPELIGEIKILGEDE